MGVTADKLPGVARYVIADCKQLSMLVIDKPMKADLNRLLMKNQCVYCLLRSH